MVKLKPTSRTLIILTFLCITVGCDQVSKKIAREELAYNEEVRLAGDHLTLIKIENSGAFLSLGDSWPRLTRLILLTFLPLIVLAGALVFLLTKRNLPNALVLGICLVIGGGIGNFYDRLLYGSVTDFLHLDFGLFRTGIFNLADLSIMTGAFVILVASYSGRSINRKLEHEKGA